MGSVIVPGHCELCMVAIQHAFVHGKTYVGVTRGMPGGRWADMCLGCHAKHGVGLGPDAGQQYELQWEKRVPALAGKNAHIPIGWKKVRG